MVSPTYCPSTQTPALFSALLWERNRNSASTLFSACSRHTAIMEKVATSADELLRLNISTSRVNPTTAECFDARRKASSQEDSSTRRVPTFSYGARHFPIGQRSEVHCPFSNIFSGRPMSKKSATPFPIVHCCLRRSRSLVPSNSARWRSCRED